MSSEEFEELKKSKEFRDKILAIPEVQAMIAKINELGKEIKELKEKCKQLQEKNEQTHKRTTQRPAR